MKVGEKILCIESVKYDKTYHFKKGKYYEINKINDGHSIFLYFIENELLGTVKSAQTVCFGGYGAKFNGNNTPYLLNHFSDKRQLLNKKLKKIKKCVNSVKEM